MSHRLHVLVRLNGSVVEDRVVDVHGDLWLGAKPDAAVSFPGGDVCVRPTSAGLAVDDSGPLEVGAPVVRRFGPVELRLERTSDEPAPRDWGWLPDPLLLVATAALLLVDAFLVQFGGFP